MLKAKNFLYLQRRFKGGKQRWSTQQSKKTSTDRALESFDDFYGSVFGVRWRNIRAALLSEHKYIAMVNNFGDTEKTCSWLEMDGAINVKSLAELAKERLVKDDQPETQISSFPLEERLEDIIKKKEELEKISIYPEGVEESIIPQKLQYRDEEIDNSKSKVNNEPDIDDSEDEYEIDYSRMISPELGTGALYQYVPATRLRGMEDWIPESDHYKYYQTEVDFPLNIELERDFSYPENLCLYTYEMGNVSDFRYPRKCLTGVLSHFLMDGASVLPPLFLDVKHGDRVLDACAAPGGKSLLMLQTLHPDVLICNDIQESRINRTRKVMQEYLFDYNKHWEGKRLIFNRADARNIEEYESFDKILVDVPCTTDRHSLMENDNNIFKPGRIKERLRIPELQSGILTNCLRLLKPGGSLVYSTCSLSPVQNDGVVHMSLQKAFNEYGITATIKDLSWLTRLFQDIYSFENSKSLKYGQMVLPYLPANFGPMYFSKITRDT